MSALYLSVGDQIFMSCVAGACAAVAVVAFDAFGIKRGWWRA